MAGCIPKIIVMYPRGPHLSYPPPSSKKAQPVSWVFKLWCPNYTSDILDIVEILTYSFVFDPFFFYLRYSDTHYLVDRNECRDASRSSGDDSLRAQLPHQHDNRSMDIARGKAVLSSGQDGDHPKVFG